MKTVSDSMQLEVNGSGGCTKQNLGLAFEFKDKNSIDKKIKDWQKILDAFFSAKNEY